MVIKPTDQKTHIEFDIQDNVPVVGKNSAERRANDKKAGSGTMNRSGVICPCCGSIFTNDDIRLEGKAGRIGTIPTAVVFDSGKGKRYRKITCEEKDVLDKVHQQVEKLFGEVIPFGLPKEPTPGPAGSKMNSSSLRIYGITEWDRVFTERQLLVIGTLIKETREVKNEIASSYGTEWKEAIIAYLSSGIAKVADRASTLCTWTVGWDKIGHTFTRFALPITWDFVESVPIEDSSGGYPGAIDWVSMFIDHATTASMSSPTPHVIALSSKLINEDTKYDLIITDPPYYDAISYSDLMDFFYIWHRRTLVGLSSEFDKVFDAPLAPKWDDEKDDGELIDNPARFGGDKEKSKKAYEDGMSEVFANCNKILDEKGRMVIVFANKSPDAWETLVSSIVRAGFVVAGSWPIQTEMGNRTRALSSAALASSVWLVCRKRSPISRPGWDNQVLEVMRKNIVTHLRDFWDAGIRGPDFVWAATGPAMEAYSQYPVVKKANEPGSVMTVSEFLTHVRRIVVDFVVGRVLTGDGAEEVSGLDNITTYYLLHRHDFGFADAPAGPCILYAVSCGLSDKDLADRYDLLARRGGKEQEEPDEDEDGEEGEVKEGSGSSFRLKTWSQRKNPNIGYDRGEEHSTEKLPLFPDMEREAQQIHEIPLIDQVHRLMHLWKGGDVSKVNEYLDLRGLRRNQLFHQLLQALIELSSGEERSLLESISNHIGGKQINQQYGFNIDQGSNDTGIK